MNRSGWSAGVRCGRVGLPDGAPVLGISVFGALDDIGPGSLDGILSGKLSTYRTVHLVSVGRVTDAGFDVRPTFGRPHMTLLLGDVDRIESLLEFARPGPGQFSVWCTSGEDERDDRR